MPWPYDNRGGLLGRWQTPNQMRDPFQGFQAPPPPPKNYGQMPWDQSQGQGFDDLYKPKPQPPQQPWSPAGRQEVPWWAGGAGGKPTKPAARPQKPAATPQQPYEAAMGGLAMPQQGPRPPQQMPSQDAAMAAYPDYQQAPQRAGGLGGLQPQQPMQYDASMAAYPEQPQVQRQPQPGEQATGNNAAGDGKLLGFDPMDWISMGLALMGGANQNGGDWSVPAQAMQNIQSRQYQEKRDAKEDERYEAEAKRQAEIDRRAAEVQGLEIEDIRRNRERFAALTKSRDELATSLEKTNPEFAAALRGTDPLTYGQVYAGYIQSQEESTKADERLTRELNSRERIAKLSSENENSIFRAFQSKDASLIAEKQAEALDIQANTLPAMRTLLANIKQAGEYEDATGQVIPANLRVPLSRVFNGSSDVREKLTTWQSRVLKPAIAMFAGTGALAAQELELGMKSFANPDMDLGAAVELVEEMIATKERQLMSTNALSNYYNTYGGITRPMVPGAPPVTQYMTGVLEGTGFTPGREGREKRAAAAGGVGAAPAAPASSNGQRAAKVYPSPNTNALTMLRQDQSPASLADFETTYGRDNLRRALAQIKAQEKASAPAYNYD